MQKKRLHFKKKYYLCRMIFDRKISDFANVNRVIARVCGGGTVAITSRLYGVLPEAKGKSGGVDVAYSKANRGMGKVCLVLVSIILSFNSLDARTISGKVTLHNYDIPAVGASVLIKGTNIGTVTDIYGNYSLNVDTLYTTLVFAYFWSLPLEVNIGNDSIIDVSLIEKDFEINEIVVNAFVYQNRWTSERIERLDTIVTRRWFKTHVHVRKFETVQMIEPETYYTLLRTEKQWDLRHGNSDYSEYDFFKYLYENINYPELSILKGITGRVFVQFKIGLDGNVKDIKILRGFDELIETELLSIIEKAPNFTQSEINHFSWLEPKHYVCSFYLPIRFTITEVRE